MSKKDEFEALANQWVQHCKEVMLSSNMRDYLNHPAYQKLVALGDDAVLVGIERYRRDDFTPWGFLLEDITGQGIIKKSESVQSVRDEAPLAVLVAIKRGFGRR